ncbi:hypothetical protein PFTANZ_05037 [Plasmodium falciparum Tanzania (2000708)]|uniref:Uncharacterized protein n=1 Tax=Plasmodium falciparum Tanzania (2000708) TaxID=1036725 RepID=A0A024W154_PLAFA|nr:hypothetical protein PFTANZ_05037 [Plasmodium falciparum Tanzania (2000708)]
MNIFKRIKYFLLDPFLILFYLYKNIIKNIFSAYLFSFKPSIKYYAKKVNLCVNMCLYYISLKKFINVFKRKHIRRKYSINRKNKIKIKK